MTNLRKILEEAYMRGYGYDLKEVSVDQAHQKILALLPKKKEKDWAGGSNDEWMYEELRKEGYNQAIQDMKQKLEGE